MMGILNDIMTKIYQDYENSMIQFAEWKPPVRIECSRDVLYQIKADLSIFQHLTPRFLGYGTKDFENAMNQISILIEGEPAPIVVDPNRKEGWEVVY